MVEDRVVGRLAPKGDIAALAESIAFLRDLPPEETQRMRMRCRQTVLARFTILHQARTYAELYESLLVQDRHQRVRRSDPRHWHG